MCVSDESTTDQNWMSVHTNNQYSGNTSIDGPGGEQEGVGEGGDCDEGRGGASPGHQSQGHKSGSNSPSDGSPSKRRSGPEERELYTFIQELDQER